MKKHVIIALAIFAIVTSLALASNFIRWDETPLEQTIYALPLGIGLLLQMPFFGIISVDNPVGVVNYKLIESVMPFAAGALYASLYYLIVYIGRKITGQ